MIWFTGLLTGVWSIGSPAVAGLLRAGTAAFFKRLSANKNSHRHDQHEEGEKEDCYDRGFHGFSITRVPESARLAELFKSAKYVTMG
ncbi:MAG TPA: hypothetical protein P5246_06000 [Candidatus Omnitrophota bacterium]|nr:hypothetical protein [Candidatus Omnitrophota bacterium]